MQEDSRGKWTAFAVILAVLVLGILLVVVLGGGSSKEEYTLKLERLPAAADIEELVVSIPKAVNASSVARGRQLAPTRPASPSVRPRSWSF